MANADKINVRDSDLMLLADGELDAAQVAELEAALEPEHRAKMAAIGDLGHAVRGHLELSTDEAAPRMARMWEEIDKRISLDARAATPTKAIPAPARGTDQASPRGFWGSVTRWFDDHRSHVMTGVLSAGAVAAVTLFLGSRRETIEKPVYVSTPTVQVPETGGPAGARPRLVSTPPSVDTLDVTGGSGTVFTIEDEDGGTAVIWVTSEDTVEGL